MSQTIDRTMSIQSANRWGMILMVPIFVLFFSLFFLLWGYFPFVLANDVRIWLSGIIILVVSIVVHEGLHGIGYRWGGATWQEIQFGIKHLSPYAHCQVALPLNAYRLAVALPGLVLGVLPAMIGILLGNIWLTFYGTLMTITASGDLLILWLIWSAPPNCRVLDHPSLVGCQLILDTKI